MNIKDFLYKTIVDTIDENEGCMKFDFSLEEDEKNYIILYENEKPIIEFSKEYCGLFNNNFEQYRKIEQFKSKYLHSLLKICKKISDNIHEYNNPTLCLLKQNGFDLGNEYCYNESYDEFYIVDKNNRSLGYYNFYDDSLTVFGYEIGCENKSYLKSQIKLLQLVLDNSDVFNLSEDNNKEIEDFEF